MKLSERFTLIAKIEDKVLTPETPELLRKVLWATVIFFAFIGFCIGARLIGKSPFAALYAFGFFLLLGIASDAVVIIYWRFLNKLSNRRVLQLLDEKYRSFGISKEAADCLKAASFVETATQKVLRLFLMVQAEYYRDSEPLFAEIDETALTPRQYAMYLTTRLRLYLMTGKFDKATILYGEHSDFLRDTYNEEPELLGEYKPYADDVLDFYLLSAALDAQNQRMQQEEEDRKSAQFRISLRDETDMIIYPQIMDLNHLFATARLKEAHLLENELRGRIGSAAIPAGRRAELDRLAAQARIFAAHTQVKTQLVSGERVMPR